MGLPLRELRFRDRAHAGQALATRLPALLRHEAPIVVAVSGGGVPVAAEVARALGADLDVLVVQAVRSPNQPRVVAGVLAEGGSLMLDRGASLTDEELDDATVRARRELRRRAHLYRAGRPLPDLGGRTVVLVDDGILTGRTMSAAVAALARFQPARVIAAAPVAATMAAHHLRREADELVTVTTVGDLRAVADAYDDFHPLVDAEVLGELARARAAVQADVEIVVAEVDVEVEGAARVGTLTIPRDARAVAVVCAGEGRGGAARATAFELLAEEIGTLIIDAGPSSAAYIAGIDCVRRWPGAAGLAVSLFGDDDDALSRAVAARPGVLLAEAVR